VRIWGTRTWAPQAEFAPGHFSPDGHLVPTVVALAFSPAGRHLALGAFSWRSAPPRPLATRHANVEGVHATLFLGGWGVSAFAFRPDGKAIAVATGGAGVVLWGVNDDRALLTISTELDCLALAFLPDGRSLLGAVRRNVIVWDATTGAVRATLSGHKDEVRGLALTPDGRTLLSASKDKTVRVWDVASGAERAVLDWKVGALNCVAVALDGKTAAAAGRSGTVVVWDLEAP
jgi:WD40 repeat protein